MRGGDDPRGQHIKLKMELVDHHWNSGSSSTHNIRHGGVEKGDADIVKRQDNDLGEDQELDLNLSLIPAKA